MLQAIGTMTVLACQGCGSKTVVLTGSMTTLDQVVPNFRFFEQLYGIHDIVPDNATFATAIGAGLCSLKKKAWQLKITSSMKKSRYSFAVPAFLRLYQSSSSLSRSWTRWPDRSDQTPASRRSWGR